MLQHVNNCLIIDYFIESDTLIRKSYNPKDIDVLRDLLITTTINYNHDQTIAVVAYCGGEFCNINSFEASLSKLQTFISQLNTKYSK